MLDMGELRAATPAGQEHATGEARPGGPARPAARGAVTRRSYSRTSLAWLAVPLAVGALAAGVYLNGVEAEEIASVAILEPVLGASDTDTAVIGDAMRDGLVTSLRPLPRLRVVEAPDASIPATTLGDARALGLRLDVDAVVTGRAVRQGDMIAVSAELVAVADGARRWGGSVVRPAAELFAVQEELAAQIAAVLRPELGAAARQALGRRPTENHTAYLLYITGRRQAATRTVPGLEAASASLKQAIHEDPAFALARDALADCARSLDRLR